ncbi:MAG: hypothetical protein GX485_05140 [Clostridiales bacterium]|jgi:putative tributyrin esterase|nr:hypothetical protein [Clostridiales bacterium]
MPEVQRNFYFDTRYGPKFFTYGADELPEICGRWFRLPQEREKTFIQRAFQFFLLMDLQNSPIY